MATTDPTIIEEVYPIKITYKTVITKAVRGFNDIQNILKNKNVFDKTLSYLDASTILSIDEIKTLMGSYLANPTDTLTVTSSNIGSLSNDIYTIRVADPNTVSNRTAYEFVEIPAGDVEVSKGTNTVKVSSDIKTSPSVTINKKITGMATSNSATAYAITISTTKTDFSSTITATATSGNIIKNVKKEGWVSGLGATIVDASKSISDSDTLSKTTTVTNNAGTTYIPAAEITPGVTSLSHTLTPSNAILSDTDNGIKLVCTISAKGTATTTAGYTPATTITSSTTSSSTSTKYISAITIPSGKSLNSITNNGTAKVIANTGTFHFINWKLENNTTEDCLDIYF